jgi:hypothetical protein
VEIDPDAQKVLKDHYHHIPIHPDARNYSPSKGEFDLITSGIPCTGTSTAGTRTGLDHEESALFREVLRILWECKPKFSIIDPWELSLADLEQSWGDSEWLATKANIKLCRRKNSVQVTNESDFLLFPTPTANLGTYRQAGTNRLETWLRGNGLIPNGSQLNAIAYALIQGFPSNWFQALAHPQNTLPIGLLVPLTRQDESEPESLQAEPSPPHRPPSPSSESCTSTHCSNCNSFDNSIPDSSPWKFCLLKGSYTKESDLTTCEDFIPVIPYEAPPKTRRFKGEGSGNIRTRKSHDTDQYNYHFELWKDRKRLIKSTTYIPKGKITKIREMEANKEPVEAILRELGKQISADGILTRGDI